MQFLDELLGLYYESKLSAKAFCTLCFWANKAKMIGDAVARYAYKPDSSSGNYQKHLDIELHLAEKKKELLRLTVPGVALNEPNGTSMQLICLPPHEIMEAEVADSNAEMSMRLRIADMISSGELPPAYESHPVVVANPGDCVVPLTVYLDGVPYSNTDSVVGVWVENIATGSRGIVATVRKNSVCACGCKGRCTYWHVMRMLEWSFGCLADGRHPTAMPDGSDFLASDHRRGVLSGTALKFKAAMVYFKGDWAEYCERLGFPTSAHNLRPCFQCSTPPGEAMYDPVNASLGGSPAWHLNDDADFQRAMEECEIDVVLTRELRDKIAASLRFDKRQNGSHGRALRIDIPEANLKANDRLDPSPALQNVMVFEAISSFPTTVKFWRPSRSTLVHFRSPFWNDSLGITPCKCVALDLLHCFHLGSLHAWAKQTIWFLMEAGVWAPRATDAAERRQVSAKVLTAQLKKLLWGVGREEPRQTRHQDW